MKKKKPTFWEFIKNIYGISYIDYRFNLSKDEKRALEIDYLTRYGAPIDWSVGI